MFLFRRYVYKGEMEYCRIVEAPQYIFYNLQCVYKVDIDFEAPQARKF